MRLPAQRQGSLTKGKVNARFVHTPGLRQSATRKKCKKTQSKIIVRLRAGTGGFWTGQHLCRSFALFRVQTEYGDSGEIWDV